MKKFWISLGLTLILVGWGWEGSHGLGTRPVCGQPYYAQPYYCDPNYYDRCYSATYVDPNAKYFLYWAVPQIEGEILEHRRFEHEREEHERYEHRGHEGRGHERR